MVKVLRKGERLGRMALLILCGALIAIRGGGSGDGGEATSARRGPYAGMTPPEPPRQGAPWLRPRTALPGKLVDAVEVLFAQGMADPRGCEYQQVELEARAYWKEPVEPMRTHAWVLPAPPAGGRRFAVCWDGLVYPLRWVGDREDAAADAVAVAEADRRAEQEWNQTHGQDRRYYPSYIPDVLMADPPGEMHDSLTPLKVCMLLRIGETAAAEAYWQRLPGRTAPGNADPYPWLAEEWAWGAYLHAINAHERGDDGTAFAVARLLTIVGPGIESARAASWSKSSPPASTDPNNQAVPARRDPRFLETLPDLLADSERRLKERAIPAARPLPLAAALRIADKGQRIDALILALEEDGRWRTDTGRPYFSSWREDPAEEALKNEGEGAVGPLLHCLEYDARLSRSAFGRIDHHGLYTHLAYDWGMASDGAFDALRLILHTEHFGPVSDGAFARRFWNYGCPAASMADRRAVAKEIRACLERAAGKTAAQYRYATLADDGASINQWVESAEAIVKRPDDGQACPGRCGTLPMAGEELRGRDDPGVSALLARRARQAMPPADRGAGYFNPSVWLAADLSDWDRAAAVPLMRELLARYIRLEGDDAVRSLASRLADAGDPKALTDYADWLRRQQPRPSHDGLVGLLEPIWRHPNDPAVGEAVRLLFAGPAAPYNGLPWMDDGDVFSRPGQVLASPMIAVPWFRDYALAGLADRSRLGVMSEQDGEWQVTLDSRVAKNAEPMDVRHLLGLMRLTPGERDTYRVCDWFAVSLGQLDGSPEFELWWPRERRDAALTGYAGFLRRWAGHFRDDDPGKRLFNPPWSLARMTFPRLDHPATPQDVRDGLAIFSLTEVFPAGRVRVVPPGPFPVRAKWKTLTRFPVSSMVQDRKTGQARRETHYDRVGLIWQAEEVWESGRWRRYYGFVGHHVIARVPAEEIEVLTDDRFAGAFLD